MTKSRPARLRALEDRVPGLPAWMIDNRPTAPQLQQQPVLHAPSPDRREDDRAAEESGDKVWVFHF